MVPSHGVLPGQQRRENSLAFGLPPPQSTIGFQGNGGGNPWASFSCHLIIGYPPALGSEIPPFSVFGYSPGSGGHKTQNVSFPLPGETPEVTQRREWKRKSFVTAGKTWPTNVDWNPMPGLSSSLWAGRLQGFPPLGVFLGFWSSWDSMGESLAGTFMSHLSHTATI